MTAVEMEARLRDVLSPWAIRLIEDAPFPREDAFPTMVNAAMEIQDQYFRTPHHSTTDLTESEVMYCLFRGIKALGQKYYSVKSPIDPPGMEGPMAFGAWINTQITGISGNRQFTGAAAEPHPPMAGGGVVDGGWSWGGGPR
jgi:hypothetical protein